MKELTPNYPTSGKYNNVWYVARSSSKLTPLIAKLVRIAGSLLSREFTQRCSLCNLLAKQVTVHTLCFCMANRDRQIKLWDTVTDTDTDNFIFSRNCTYQLHGYIQNES